MARIEKMSDSDFVGLWYHDYEQDEDFGVISLVVMDDLDKNLTNEFLENALRYVSMMGLTAYGLLNHNLKLMAYGVSVDTFKKIFRLKPCARFEECDFEGERIEVVPFTREFFLKLYNINNQGLQTCIALLTIFPDDAAVMSKLKKRVETYIIPRVALELCHDCIIEPQKELLEYRMDNVFVIRADPELKMPDICLEIDEDGHRSYTADGEKLRENIIKAFGHRLIRYPIKREPKEEEMEQAVYDLVSKIRLMINDIRAEYSEEVLEEDFLKTITRYRTIDMRFARFFSQKSKNVVNATFKYHFEEVAEFLEYGKTTFNNTCGSYQYVGAGFIQMMKRYLTLNEHYIIQKELKVTGPAKGAPKQVFWINRLGFYMLCMASDKPVAMRYRIEFGKVYEATIDYVQSKKRSLIKALPNVKQSVDSVKRRIQQKVSEKSLEQKYKERNETLELENQKLREENDKLQRDNDSKNLTIADLAHKWCQSNRQKSIAYLLDDLQMSLERKFRTLTDTLAELQYKVRDMQLAH